MASDKKSVCDHAFGGEIHYSQGGMIVLESTCEKCAAVRKRGEERTTPRCGPSRLRDWETIETADEHLAGQRHHMPKAGL